MIKALAREEQPAQATSFLQGWWRRPRRFVYPPLFTEAAPCRADEIKPAETKSETAGPPLVITGASGTLGQAFVQGCRDRDLNYVVCTREELDITDSKSIEWTLSQHSPWAVINTAGYVRVDDAEQDAQRCHQANAHGAATLAEACSTTGVRLLTFSSALVFAGDREVPYLEPDEVRPLNVYGRSKAEAERRALAAYPDTLVVRTSAFFGPWDRYNFLTLTLDRLQAGLRVDVAEDWIVSPTYLPDLVHRCLDLLIDGESGLWHLANEGTTSWADFARQAARLSGIDDRGLRGCRGEELRLPACRPRFSVLGSKHGRLLPPLNDGIRRYCESRRVSPANVSRGVAVAAAQEAR
jgi:dTDP-4-dehydrorhamnose reductase